MKTPEKGSRSSLALLCPTMPGWAGTREKFATRKERKKQGKHRSNGRNSFRGIHSHLRGQKIRAWFPVEGLQRLRFRAHDDAHQNRQKLSSRESDQRGTSAALRKATSRPRATKKPRHLGRKATSEADEKNIANQKC